MATSATRYLGWQDTPIVQATFGRTTRGGRNNTKFGIKNSTGPLKETEGKWYVLDASEAPIGRVATVAATLLMGKHRATFTPGAGSNDGVILINAEKAFFTSDKAEKKVYYDHSLWMGGLKSQLARDALKERPEEVLWMAVQGMLPKNKLSRYQLTHLKIYKGSDHKHQPQKPVTVSVAKTPLKNLGV